MASNAASAGTLTMDRSSTATADNGRRSSNPPPLPLGWTRINRKRPETNSDSNVAQLRDSSSTATAAAAAAASDIDNDEDNNEDKNWCCDDPSCSRQLVRIDASIALKESKVALHGQVLFCLLDDDPSWMQGYFVIRGRKKPWGLLAVVQPNLDDCLVCADGGYRRITLNIYPFETNRKRLKKTVVLRDIEWTGGDMIRLSSESVIVESEKLLTGRQAIPTVQKYFASILRRLNPSYRNPSSGEEILKWIPNVMVVTGFMSIKLPPTNNDDE